MIDFCLTVLYNAGMKLLKHLYTITKHRHKVMRLCFKVGIGFQGLSHDLSKYGITELKTGAKYYAGYRSPNSFERDEKGYSDAWLHHKGRNKHHYEYWVDYSTSLKKDVAVPMPMNYLVESLCDRIAASKVYKGASYTDRSPLEYYLEGTDSVRMHPDSAATVHRWLVMLGEKGEKETLAAVKKELKEWKKAKKRAPAKSKK